MVQQIAKKELQDIAPAMQQKGPHQALVQLFQQGLVALTEANYQAAQVIFAQIEEDQTQTHKRYITLWRKMVQNVTTQITSADTKMDSQNNQEGWSSWVEC